MTNKDEKWEALSLLASATDLLNSWAREMSVKEAFLAEYFETLEAGIAI